MALGFGNGSRNGFPMTTRSLVCKWCDKPLTATEAVSGRFECDACYDEQQEAAAAADLARSGGRLYR